MSTKEFHELVISNSDQLKPFAIAFTRDKEDAKDLLQETLCRAMTKGDTYYEAANIKAWLYTIMRNTFINNYRREHKQRENLSRYHRITLPEKGFTNANAASDRLQVKEIQAAIHTLPEVLRIPFCLKYEGFQYREIAAIMQIAIGTAKSRIHFARKLLKQRVAQLAELQ